MSEKLFTIPEAAEELHIKPRTVREYIRTGRLKAFKYVNSAKSSWLIKDSEIKRLKGE